MSDEMRQAVSTSTRMDGYTRVCSGPVSRWSVGVDLDGQFTRVLRVLSEGGEMSCVITRWVNERGVHGHEGSARKA